MLSKQIFDILPIPLFAVGFLTMLLLHSAIALVLGGLLIGLVCCALFLRLHQKVAEPNSLSGNQTIKPWT